LGASDSFAMDADGAGEGPGENLVCVPPEAPVVCFNPGKVNNGCASSPSSSSTSFS
jgi:hypothetical protein